MPDAQQGPRSWFERLSSPAEADPDESKHPASEAGAVNSPSGGAAPQQPHPTGEHGEAAPPAAAPPTRVVEATDDANQDTVTWRGEAPSPSVEQAESGGMPRTPEAPMSNPSVSGGATEPTAASPKTVDTPMPSSGAPAVQPGPAGEGESGPTRKWQIEELQHRWLITQAQLLDDPREAVHEAGLLIGEAMQLVTAAFTAQRDQIEREWKSNANLDTDELRSVMQRYRKLFQYVLRACNSSES